jgi:hypothetical protein
VDVGIVKLVVPVLLAPAANEVTDRMAVIVTSSLSP